MTPAESAFLAAILANPGDDSPRLVFADWLEENAGTVTCPECHGEGNWSEAVEEWVGCDRCRGAGRVSDGRAERAEFIRVQCRLAHFDITAAGWENIDRDYAGSIVGNLRRREREAWVQGVFCRYCEWHAPLPHNTSFRWEFRRGLVDLVTCTAADWLAHGPAVVACQPITEVRLSDPEVWANPTYYGDNRLTLPGELFHHIYPYWARDYPDGPRVLSRSPEEERAALSAACLAWASQSLNTGTR